MFTLLWGGLQTTFSLAIFPFLVLGDEVGLGQQQPVGKADLRLSLRMGVELAHGMHGIDGDQHGVEHVVAGHRFIEKEGLRHRAGVGQSGRFDHHALEIEFSRGAARGQFAEDAH